MNKSTNNWPQHLKNEVKTETGFPSSYSLGHKTSFGYKLVSHSFKSLSEKASMSWMYERFGIRAMKLEHNQFLVQELLSVSTREHRTRDSSMSAAPGFLSRVMGKDHRWSKPEAFWVCNLLVTKPENVMLIHPPIRIIGRTLVTLPFIMSVSMVGSKTEKQAPNSCYHSW